MVEEEGGEEKGVVWLGHLTRESVLARQWTHQNRGCHTPRDKSRDLRHPTPLYEGTRPSTCVQGSKNYSSRRQVPTTLFKKTIRISPVFCTFSQWVHVPQLLSWNVHKSVDELKLSTSTALELGVQDLAVVRSQGRQPRPQ